MLLLLLLNLEMLYFQKEEKQRRELFGEINKARNNNNTAYN